MKSALLSGYFRDGVEPNGRREPAEPWLGSIPNGDSSHNFFIDSLRGEGLDEIERGESSLVPGESKSWSEKRARRK
jgi:hypothetical protein